MISSCIALMVQPDSARILFGFWFCPGTHDVAEEDLELLILLGNAGVTSGYTRSNAKDTAQSFVYARQALYQPSCIPSPTSLFCSGIRKEVGKW